MKLVENISNEELEKIETIVGEAFVSNELFHEFGDLESRKELVMKYLKIYVNSVYKMKALYQNENGTAFIGLSFSDEKNYFIQIKMLVKLLFLIPFSIQKKFLRQIRQIKDGNLQYASKLHLEVHMVCVSKENQGKGLAKELVEFAKEKAASRNVPLLFNTDMKSYAEMYQHFGCRLYNTKTASNGVTRYNLVWKKDN